MAHLRVYGRFLREYGRLAILARRWRDPSLFLHTAYRVFLKRAPDVDGLNYYLHELQNGHMSRRDVLRSITNSTEYRQIYGRGIGTLEALHQARALVFRELLPPAQVVVDLGGAAHGHPEGALLFLGYPYRPREINIIDLPPDDRLSGATGAEAAQELITSDGVRVRYIYGSMSELAVFDDQSADMVISGESIEHIAEAEADAVCREVYRILRPGGCFCLDTPNAALTRILSPDKLIHPEHQKEYYVHEMESKLRWAGFEIADMKGICPMPNSLRNKEFDYGEMIRNIRLCDNPREGFLFFIRAAKPAAG
jgi:ubiquinone/menaquinone biosynthesis C-methylase UbiE